ncbi:hypothetical protein ACN6L5_04170, partial [Staphylococcus aureus]
NYKKMWDTHMHTKDWGINTGHN